MSWKGERQVVGKVKMHENTLQRLPFFSILANSTLFSHDFVQLIGGADIIEEPSHL